MISLSRHIEILLLEHDCVIVPGLGGFIANQASARMDDNDNQCFLPPYRTIGFNRELSVNDGLLVQSYMQAYDAAYPEALLQMEKDINKMTVQLDTIGSYTLDGIGVLNKNIDGSLSFTALESGILTPSLYGLYSIEIKTLEEAKKEKEIQKSLSQISILPIQTETDINSVDNKPTESVTSEKEVEKGQKKSKIKNIDSRIKRIVNLRPNWKEFAVAASVAAVMFFLFHFPSLKSNEELSDTVVASSIYLGTPNEMGNATPNKEKTVVSKPASYKSIADKIVEENRTAAKPQKTLESKNQNTTINSHEYVIVLASCVNAKNAKIFVDNFEKEGFKEARFVEGKPNRVLYSGYATQQEATEALTNLRSQSSSFKDAWILHMN